MTTYFVYNHIFHREQPEVATKKGTGLILGLRPANKRRLYNVTPSLTGWAQTKDQLSGKVRLYVCVLRIQT